MNVDTKASFRFKLFEVNQEKSSMKVNTDGIILGAWTDVDFSKTALDIGTGTGIIAIMAAQRNENLNVVGIDIDQDSSIESADNMSNSPFASRLTSKCISLQDFVNGTNEKFDLIVSNPPFFSGGTFSNNENKNNVRHTVKLSHSDLLFSVKKLLSPAGHFDLILPYIEGLRFIELASQYDLYLQRLTEVKSKEDKSVERLLLSFSSQKTKAPKKTNLTIYAGDNANDYTEEFKELTKEFYLFL